MLSKRNKKLMIEKQAAKKQRYGLRKLSVGVASVLLGLTFLGANSISAAENELLGSTMQAGQVETIPEASKEQNTVTIKNQEDTDAQTAGQEKHEFEEEKTVTRTINYLKDGQPICEPKVQTVVFHRYLGGEWYVKGDHMIGVKTGKFDAVVSPALEGYTPDKAQVDEMPVSADTENLTINVNYTANETKETETKTVKRTINIYQDGEFHRSEVQSVVFTRDKFINNADPTDIRYGEWDKQEDVLKAYDANLGANYELDGAPVSDLTVKPDDQDVTVDLRYKAKKEFVRTEEKTVKRVINIYKDGKKVDEVTQTATFKRDVFKNLATGELESGNWDEESIVLDAFVGPEFENYKTPANYKLPRIVVTPDTEDIVVNLNYTSNVEVTTETKTVKRVINIYKDGVKVDEVTQSVVFEREVRHNLATNTTEYGEWNKQEDVLKAYDAPVYENYTPDVEKINDKVVKPDDKDEEVSINYKSNVEVTTEYKTVKRVINIYKDGVKVDEVTQSVVFEREVRHNLATNTTEYGEWNKSEDEWAVYDAPVYENYTPDIEKIDSKTVKPDDKDEEVSINYSAKIDTWIEERVVRRTILMHMPNGEIKRVTQDVTFKREMKKNLVTGEMIEGAWGMTKITFPEYTVPQIENYVPTMAKVEAVVVTPDTESWTVDIYYSPAEKSEIEYSTVKRVINIYQDGKKVDEITQSVTFKREVKINLVTGEKTFGEWDRAEDEWAAYEAPVYANYTPDVAKIDSKTVKPDDKDEEVSINYTSNIDTRVEYSTVKRVINIYQDGKKVDEITQSVTFKREVKINLVTGEKTFGEWDRAEDEWAAYEAPVYANYTPDVAKIDSKTVKPDDKDEEVSINYTSKVATELEERVVDRTIILNLPNGFKREHIQSVTFKREVKRNLATNEVTYGTWDILSTEFEAYSVPEFEGYIASVQEISTLIVDPDSQSTKVEVDYYKIDRETKDVKRTFNIQVIDGLLPRELLNEGSYGYTQSVTFARTIYVNATGEVVYVGDWEESEKYFEGFAIPPREGYTTRRTEIAQKLVTPDSEDTIEDILYVAYAADEETKTVNRKITIIDPEGEIHVIEQQGIFKRQNLIDQFTGSKTLGEWIVEKDILEGITLPEFSGYKPTQQVEELQVTPESEDSELEIRYEKANTPENGGGTTPDTPENGGETTPDTPENGGETTPDTPENGGETTPDTPENGGGTTPDTPENGGETTPDTPENDVEMIEVSDKNSSSGSDHLGNGSQTNANNAQGSASNVRQTVGTSSKEVKISSDMSQKNENRATSKESRVANTELPQLGEKSSVGKMMTLTLGMLTQLVAFGALKKKHQFKHR